MNSSFTYTFSISICNLFCFDIDLKNVNSQISRRLEFFFVKTFNAYYSVLENAFFINL